MRFIVGVIYIPVGRIGPLISLLVNLRTASDADKTRLHADLEAAIRAARLSFVPTAAGDARTSKKTKKSVEVKRRLECLRVLDKERLYGKLARNLWTHSSTKDDDITTRSMMYTASSVGLNMIIAPISFNVFMYFFAGEIFGRFFDG